VFAAPLTFYFSQLFSRSSQPAFLHKIEKEIQLLWPAAEKAKESFRDSVSEAELTDKKNLLCKRPAANGRD
jgi:hypothetical protein